jgi:hypothetical protein
VAGPSSKAGKANKSGKRFEIKKWNAVAMWSWAICTDTCAICRNNLYEPSIEYQANPTGACGVLGNVVWPGVGTSHARAPLCALLCCGCRRPRPPGAEHRLGRVRPRVPPGLHPALAQGAQRVPTVQQGVGVCQDRAHPGRCVCHGGGALWRNGASSAPTQSTLHVPIGQQAAISTGQRNTRPAVNTRTHALRRLHRSHGVRAWQASSAGRGIWEGGCSGTACVTAQVCVCGGGGGGYQQKWWVRSRCVAQCVVVTRRACERALIVASSSKMLPVRVVCCLHTV